MFEADAEPIRLKLPGNAWVSAPLIAIATVIAYANSLRVPFVYDDSTAIVSNPHVRSLWPLQYALSAPDFTSLTGRPLVAFSLALNFLVSELNPWSYHAVNLALHIASALLVFGIIRRLLRDRYAELAALLATGIALLWSVHPLNTQAVTYVTQRCESMMGFFFLLTLYLALRGLRASRPMPLLIGSVLACMLGMCCKEVMVGAPILVLLIDRQFIAGSFGTALRKSKFFYAGLASSWIVLGLLLKFGGVAKSANLDDNPMTSWEYLLNQSAVILHYIRLALWPDALCFDYGWPAASACDLVPACVVVGAFALATLYGVIRRAPAALLGAWFFITLAPSSSLVPLKDLANEYRMYLALAAVITGFVLLLTELARRVVPAQTPRLCLSLIALLTVALSLRTFVRNQDYDSVLHVWQKVVQSRPDHARGHNNLGFALVEAGRKEEAVQEFRTAVRQLPRADFLTNLGVTLNDLGHFEEAVDVLSRATQKDAGVAGTHAALGNALFGLDRLDDSVTAYKAALQLAPDPTVESRLGISLSRLKRFDEAMEHFQNATKLSPNFAEAYSNMGQVMLDQNRPADALSYFERALKLNPNLALAEVNSAAAHFSLKHLDAALTHLRNAVAIQPDYPAAHAMMGDIYRAQRQPEEAVKSYRQALTQILRVNPKFVLAYTSLANAQLEAGRPADAIDTYESALRAMPSDPSLHVGIGLILEKTQHPAEAAQHFTRALELNPTDAESRQHLEAIRKQVSPRN